MSHSLDPHELIIDAIPTVLSGKTYLSPVMTGRIVKSRVGGMIKPGKSPIESLSDLELEVLTLIGQGGVTSAIAKQLYLSVHTFDTYREKLNRYAAQWVKENG